MKSLFIVHKHLINDACQNAIKNVKERRLKLLEDYVFAKLQEESKPSLLMQFVYKIMPSRKPVFLDFYNMKNKIIEENKGCWNIWEHHEEDTIIFARKLLMAISVTHSDSITLDLDAAKFVGYWIDPPNH